MNGWHMFARKWISKYLKYHPNTFYVGRHSSRTQVVVCRPAKDGHSAQLLGAPGSEIMRTKLVLIGFNVLGL
jgi:hypothetical protein